jgi:hypothetical protein
MRVLLAKQYIILTVSSRELSYICLTHVLMRQEILRKFSASADPSIRPFTT